MLVRDPDNTMRLNIDSTGNVADGSPHYVAWADNAGNYNVYIDGVGDKSGSYTKNPKACNQSHIAMDGRAGETSFFAGTIYELRLSSVKRTSEWVKATNHSLFDNLYSIELPDNTYIVSEVFSLSASLSGSRFINFAHILSPAFLLSSTLAGERIGACLISAPTLTGAFSFSPSATIIRAKDILAPDFTLESSFSASIEAATIILSQVMNLSFSLLSDSQRIYWRDYFYLINSIPFDGTFALVNSLNTGVSSQVLLLNNVLAQIQGQLIVKNRFRDLVLIEGTNRIVNVLEGLYSTGEYYLDESHGI